MARFDLPLAIDPGNTRPVYVQIAEAIGADIRRGRLRPGDRLPGSRSLAESLSVHRNTVLAAYDELLAEGWVETQKARGTFVSRDLPKALRGSKPGGSVSSGAPYAIAKGLAAPLALPPIPKGTLVLAGGLPDIRLMPADQLVRSYRRRLRQERGTLGYGDPFGHPRLRAALASMLANARGVATTADTLVVTRGSQMALYLIARVLFSPGDRVVVEGLGYRPAWEAFRLAGASLVPCPIDAGGIDVDALSQIERDGPIRAIYLTPHHQYPTTVTLTAPRRLRLIEFARRNRCALIEDDYDHEFHYEGRPVLPLASADPSGSVIYVGTLSKVLAPGLRIGYLVGPKALIEAAAAVRSYVDRQGDLAVEAAVAELLEDGEVQRHVNRMRRVYAKRRDAFASALRRHLGAALSFSVPHGGMAIWARVARDVPFSLWLERAAVEGVVGQAAQQFAFDGRARPCLRLGFALRSEAELEEAVRRFARALKAVRTTPAR